MLSTLQQLTKIGHQMDGALNRYKSVLYPQRYFNYRRWLKQQRRDIPTDKPVVVFDFRDTRIDGPQGRRFYSLFIFFVRTGFYPVLRENYLMLGNIQEKYKQYCLQENFSVLADPNELPKNYILVTDKLFSALESNAFKTITVNYRPDYKSIDVCFPMPFPMFPPIYAMQQDLQLATYRRQQRQWAIFFGGDAEQGKYNKKTIREIYAKLSRAQIIQCLSTQLASDQYRELTSNDELSSAQNTEHHGLVVMNTRQCKVNPEDWLGNLARANFFLACPGVRYPMSHNLIEALAVGSIPITQYPEMFFPPLENGKNCLMFNNEDELLSVVNKAMNMNAAEIASMSHEAIEYYETYMAPTHCIQRLLNHASQRISLRLLPFLKAGGGFA
ncbi:MAG: glycosyltransferase [Cellvibrio sp.]|uniref:glycosyltransferase n=1 Tax=Cellvibrio sp. TaxID=1965322 RepID=UPI0031ABB934